MDTHPSFVRLEFCTRQKAHIVGRERRDASLQAQIDDGVGMGVLTRTTRALDLQVKPVAAQLLPASQAARGLIVAAAGKCLSDVALCAAR